MKVPHTNLSTGLKRSRRALRSRLRDLFAAPRRWGKLPLACALALVLFSTPLAACGPAAPAEEPPPALDLEDFQIRLSGEEDWTALAPLLPAPAAWAGQDLAGRDEAVTLSDSVLRFDPGLQGGFVDGEDGWLVFSSTQSLGPISDTCIYRTHDGGRTWAEAACLTGTGGSFWFSVNCAAFLDDDHAVLGTGLFTASPVFYTADGGDTWEQAALPYADLEAESLTLQDGRLLMTASRHGEDADGGPLLLQSEDQGATWTETASPAP